LNSNIVFFFLRFQSIDNKELHDAAPQQRAAQQLSLAKLAQAARTALLDALERENNNNNNDDDDDDKQQQTSINKRVHRWLRNEPLRLWRALTLLCDDDDNGDSRVDESIERLLIGVCAEWHELTFDGIDRWWWRSDESTSDGLLRLLLLFVCVY
jgi:hypothetical protein